MGWILGGVLVFSGLVVWANKRFWDQMRQPGHNNIKGLDTE